MNQQPIITELIETVSQSLKADGITAEYIQQLSYTWNALEKGVFCQALFPEKNVEIPCFHQGIFPAFGGY